MSADDAIKYLDVLFEKFSEGDRFFVDLSGKGEPLLSLKTILTINSHCIKVSNEIKKEIVVSFVTNGLLLTPNIVSLLQENGILFGISIDGPKYVHDVHRKRIDNSNSYDLIMENVKKIEKKRFLGVRHNH